MDKNIYVRCTWTISDPINITKFRDEWLSTFKECPLPIQAVQSNQDESQNSGVGNLNLKKNLLESIPADLLQELQSTCNEERLTCPEETSSYVFADIRLAKPGHLLPHLPDNYGLMTLKLQENELKKRWSDMKYKKYVMGKMKHLNSERLMVPKTRVSGESVDNSITLVQPNEVILTVIVYRHSKYYAKYNLRRGGAKYLVLGSQKLTELRDVIYCLSDMQAIGDFSQNPKLSKSEIAKDVYKSGFFFIEGVFYNDMRYPECIDYSKVLRDWIAENPDTRSKFGNCSTKLMDETTFNDLNLKQGFAYLYTHNGDCEHYVLFCDIRLINGSDSHNRADYPLCYSEKKRRGARCMVCSVFPPKWITKDHERVPADPFLFCDTCFHSYNYDAEGKKIGEFKAHPFVNL